jgi:cell division protein FtsQ
MDKNRTRKRKRRIKLKYRAYLLLLLIIICFVIYFCMESPIFDIDQITVQGNLNTSSENIISVSNICIGENIFKINASKNEKYIEDLCFVKKANIKRKLPSSVIIEIVEKEPLLIINDSGNYIYVDDELTVIETKSNNDDYKIPLLSNIEISSAEPGQKVEAEKMWIFEMIFNMATDIKNAGVLSDVSEFYITEENSVDLYTKGGSVIKIANQKIFDDNFQFIYTILSDDNMHASIELMENGNHIYKQIK